MKEILCIIDGHSQIHRAFHGDGPDLTSPSGEPTKATYIFCRTLFRIIRKIHPTYLIVAMDSNRDSLIRRQKFPGYKANRPPMDPALRKQIKRIREILEAMEICILQEDGYEADDIIATIIDSVAGVEDLEIVIVSRDKDLHQLLGPGITLFDPMDDSTLTQEDVRAKWEVEIDQLIDLQALAGDSSDGIPGVPGIGIKTAGKLLRKYGSLDNLLDHLQEIPQKPRESILSVDLELMRDLVTLDRSVPLDLDPDLWIRPRLDTRGISRIFKELGFKRWSRWGEEDS
jgi:DNA polymerase-1